jgi:NAD(P)-dependent dehydrogenase (short-subunit alcohol dehydrogenase family)
MRIPKALKAAGVALAGVMVAMRIVRNVRTYSMNGQCVFITGGSRGLGLAIAIECARRGARIAICARDSAALGRAAERLRERGTEVLPLTCDVRSAEEMRAAIKRAYETFGRIDLLVNNAGTIAVGPRESLTRQDYEDAMNTHFWAMYSAVESVLPIFQRQGGGRIANITSIGGKLSVPHLLAYSVSKFAAVGYSEGLRAELARRNVSVTTVCPGLMRTGSPRNAWFKAQHRKEYTWFTLSDTLPGFSIGARSAARTTVNAALRGEAEVVLSLPAQLAVLVHGVAPGLTANVMAIAARFLPGPGGIEQGKMRGAESTTPLTESPLTVLGKKAEREYNQIG